MIPSDRPTYVMFFVQLSEVDTQTHMVKADVICAQNAVKKVHRQDMRPNPCCCPIGPR